MNASVKRSGKGLDQLATALKEIDSKVAKVGWFENSQYEDGHTVASVAIKNEYGLGVPVRSFMRTTIAEKQEEWKKLAANLAKKVLEKKTTVPEAMEIMGLKAVGDFRKKIASITEPPLAKVTIAMRLRKYKDGKTIGSLTKPLIETKLLYTSLTHLVEDE